VAVSEHDLEPQGHLSSIGRGAFIQHLSGPYRDRISQNLSLLHVRANTPLSRRLEHLRGVVQDTRRQCAPQAVELFLAGDFNRHDQLWGGDAVGANPAQSERMPIIDFMVDH
jgi:hypothetical protein